VSASLARVLCKTHSLLLLSPTLPGSLPKLQIPEEAKENALALSFDGSVSSLTEGFRQMKERWPEGVVDVGVCNTFAGDYRPGSFLDQTEEQLRNNMEHGLIGAFTFAQHFLPTCSPPPQTPRAPSSSQAPPWRAAAAPTSPPWPRRCSHGGPWPSPSRGSSARKASMWRS